MILEKKENQTRTIKIAVYKKVIFHAWASLNLAWAIWAGQQIYELVGSKKVVWPFFKFTSLYYWYTWFLFYAVLVSGEVTYMYVCTSRECYLIIT